MQVQRFTPTSSLDPTFTSPAFDYAGQVAQASDGAHAMSIQPNG